MDGTLPPWFPQKHVASSLRLRIYLDLIQAKRRRESRIARSVTKITEFSCSCYVRKGPLQNNHLSRHLAQTLSAWYGFVPQQSQYGRAVENSKQALLDVQMSAMLNLVTDYK